MSIAASLVFLSALLLGDPAPTETEDAVAEDAEAGTIVVYRRSAIFGAAVACPVRSGGEEIVELGRGRYAELSVEPGRHILENRNASVDVSVAPGETRYVRCQVKTGFLSARADLQVVGGSEFEEIREDLRPAELLNEL